LVPRSQPHARGNYFAKFLLETKLKSKSFEPWISFLTFLVQNFWLGSHKLEIYQTGNFILTFEPDTIENHLQHWTTGLMQWPI